MEGKAAYQFDDMINALDFESSKKLSEEIEENKKTIDDFCESKQFDEARTFIMTNPKNSSLCRYKSLNYIYNKYGNTLSKEIIDELGNSGLSLMHYYAWANGDVLIRELIPYPKNSFWVLPNLDKLRELGYNAEYSTNPNIRSNELYI